MADFATNNFFSNLNITKATNDLGAEADSTESNPKLPAEKGNSGQECIGSNCLELNTPYKITYEKTNEGRNTYSSNWNQLLSGPTGCSGSYYSLGESTLKGYGVRDIKIKPEEDDLYLVYRVINPQEEGKNITLNPEYLQHVLHSHPDKPGSYTSNDPFSYTFANTDLIINFTEISYTYTCEGGPCLAGSSTASGHACCYFTRKPDS